MAMTQRDIHAIRKAAIVIQRYYANDDAWDEDVDGENGILPDTLVDGLDNMVTLHTHKREAR